MRELKLSIYEDMLKEEKNKEGKVVVIDGKKKTIRKLKPVKGTSNFFKFKYNNKTYYAVSWWDYNTKDFKVFEKNKDVPKKIWWDDIPELLDGLVEKYASKLETEEKHIPAGPDSSKFVSVQRGDISWEEDFWHSYCYSRIGYKYMFKMGTAIPYCEEAQEMIDELLTIYLNAAKTGLTLNGHPIRIGEVWGSAWIGFGIH